MRIKLIDVAENRLKIKFDKTDGIYNWGDDNSYPSLIKSLIGLSVTAKQCSDLNSKYLYGKGFAFAKNVADKSKLIVNQKGHSINQLLRLISKEYAEINNLFLHINYNALFEIISIELLKSTDVRIGKSDSKGYSGKFVVYDNWDKSKDKSIKKDNFQLIDRFNPSQAIIEKQVEASGGWSKYKGQILHITSDLSDLYSLSDADCVLLDCDSENRSSIYINKSLTQGFMGTQLMVTKPFSDDQERDEFEQTIIDLKSVENTSGVVVFEVDNVTDELDKQFFIQNIASDTDDKRFEHTESRTAKNIRKAFGIPSILIEDTDNSIFGNSGELLKSAKQLHWENKEEERSTIIEAFQMLFSRWHEPINIENDWSIIPIISVENKMGNDE